MGSQRVGYDWATELNWTELNWYIRKYVKCSKQIHTRFICYMYICNKQQTDFLVCFYSCASKSVSHSVISDSWWLHGLQHTRLLCPWGSPGKNTGVGSHSILQRIFPTQGLNPGLPHCNLILYRMSYRLDFKCKPHREKYSEVVFAKLLILWDANRSFIK